MIKVVHICASTTGGAGIAAYRLHKGLLNSGVCESKIICQSAGAYTDNQDIIVVKKQPQTFTERVLQKIRKELNTPNYRERAQRIRGSYEILTWPETSYRIELEEAVQNADIIHLHWVADFLNYPTFFKKLIAKKIVWTLHDMNPFMGVFHYKGDEERNAAYAKINNKALQIKASSLKKGTVNIVALSNWIALEAKKNPVFNKFNFNNIPNGINCNVFFSGNKMAARKQLNIPTNELIILFVSESIANYRKGIDLLLEALPMVKSNTPIRILSVGKGNLVLPANVNYTPLGQISNENELAQIYNCADFFIIPSREDNLPNVMLEALACGVPVVGFPIGGVKQYIIDLKTGLLANEVTAAALAQAIERYTSNAQSFDQTSISEFAMNNFNEKLQVDRHINFYKQLLN
jgi:glycosyltransferase involved in cell wall biosynthesis